MGGSLSSLQWPTKIYRRSSLPMPSNAIAMLASSVGIHVPQSLHFFALLLPTLLVLLVLTLRIFPLGTSNHQVPSQLRLLIISNDTLHTAHIVFRMSHVVQLRSPRSPLLPLHKLYPFHVGRIDFKPHFHTHSCQLTS